jgi:hypothetical protein
MSLVSMHAAIKAKLETIKPEILKEVYGCKINPLEKDFSDFPVAELIESGNEADYLSSKENMRVYPFEIYIYQEIEKAGSAENAYGILRSAIDVILDLFDNDQSLGGFADWVEPAISGFSDFQRRGKTIAVAIATIKAHKSKNLT